MLDGKDRDQRDREIARHRRKFLGWLVYFGLSVSIMLSMVRQAFPGVVVVLEAANEAGPVIQKIIRFLDQFAPARRKGG